MREVIDLLAAELTVGATLRFTHSRRGDPRHTEADLGVAADLLGYEPEVALPEGLRRVVAHRDPVVVAAAAT